MQKTETELWAEKVRLLSHEAARLGLNQAARLLSQAVASALPGTWVDGGGSKPPRTLNGGLR